MNYSQKSSKKKNTRARAYENHLNPNKKTVTLQSLKKTLQSTNPTSLSKNNRYTFFKDIEEGLKIYKKNLPPGHFKNRFKTRFEKSEYERIMTAVRKGLHEHKYEYDHPSLSNKNSYGFGTHNNRVRAAARRKKTLGADSDEGLLKSIEQRIDRYERNFLPMMNRIDFFKIIHDDLKIIDQEKLSASVLKKFNIYSKMCKKELEGTSLFSIESKFNNNTISQRRFKEGTRRHLKDKSDEGLLNSIGERINKYPGSRRPRGKGISRPTDTSRILQHKINHYKSIHNQLKTIDQDKLSAMYLKQFNR